MTRKVAYIMSRFPHLPETFILREMIELEKLGWKIELYPLIFQKQKHLHSASENWLNRAHHYTWISFELIIANLKQILRNPKKYFSIFFKLIIENTTNLKFLLRALIIFPKAVQMSESMIREGVHHIHAHYATHPALAAWIIHHLSGISYSITVHAHDIFVEKVMLKTKLWDASFIIAISKFNLEYLVTHLGDWIRIKTQVVHCGIDPDFYTPKKNDTSLNKRLDIINIGSLQPYKGQIYLLEACLLLRDEKIPFHCRIIGGGELYNHFRKFIASNNLEDCVELLGPKSQEEIAQILPTANCYVQPSIVTSSGKMEGIPVSIMEAMACNLPVIASSISGISELVVDKETGWLIPPTNSRKLKEILKFVYINRNEISDSILAGRARVLERFNLSINVKKISDLFEKKLPMQTNNFSS